MLREQQEKLEREIADVRVQNFRLNRLVNMSNVKTVEQAEKARVDAMNKVAEEKQKIHMAKKNCKEEIAKINKKANSMILDMKRKMQFWQVISIGSLMIGMLVGWLL